MKSIILFAAGLGSRMKHVTKEKPKPLIEIKNKPLLYWNLDFILKHDFTHLVINIHYMPRLMEEAINKYFKDKKLNLNIEIIYEPELLETGGGLKNALNYLPGEQIFTLNSDIIILPSDPIIFNKMENSYKSNMDLLLLLNPTNKSIGYTGNGDFNIDKNGQILRPKNVDKFDYMFSGLQLIKRKIIEKREEKIFSLKEYYVPDADSKVPGVYGYPIEDLTWIHLTNPDNIKEAEDKLSNF